MLTANFSQRSLFKWSSSRTLTVVRKYAVLIILIISAVLAAVTFQINRRLPQYSLFLANAIGQESQTKISFKTAHYRFPGCIVLKNVTVQGIDGKVPMLQASRITVGFFDDIAVDDMVINFPALKNYLTRHNKKIFAWGKTLPGKMRLLV